MEFLNAAKVKAVKIPEKEKLELLESVKPILSEQSEESRQSSPDTWVRHDADERTPSKVGVWEWQSVSHWTHCTLKIRLCQEFKIKA